MDEPMNSNVIPLPVAEPAPEPRYALVFEGMNVGKACTYIEALDEACRLMRANLAWNHVELRSTEDSKKVGGVWRNPKEGRLIRSSLKG